MGSLISIEEAIDTASLRIIWYFYRRLNLQIPVCDR